MFMTILCFKFLPWQAVVHPSLVNNFELLSAKQACLQLIPKFRMAEEVLIDTVWFPSWLRFIKLYVAFALTLLYVCKVAALAYDIAFLFSHRVYLAASNAA